MITNIESIFRNSFVFGFSENTSLLFTLYSPPRFDAKFGQLIYPNFLKSNTIEMISESKFELDWNISIAHIVNSFC